MPALTTTEVSARNQRIRDWNGALDRRFYSAADRAHYAVNLAT